MVGQLLARQSLELPIQLKVMTEEETKEYNLRKLYELLLKSVGGIPQLDEPTDEQKEWVLCKLEGSPWTWKRWYE